MPRAPRINSRQTIRALRRLGWEEERQRGSHLILSHPDHPGRPVVVPVHGGETLKPKTLSSIAEQAGLSIDDFRRVLSARTVSGEKDEA